MRRLIASDTETVLKTIHCSRTHCQLSHEFHKLISLSSQVKMCNYEKVITGIST